VFDELKQILVTSFQADPTEVTPDARLQDLGLDSLDMVELSLVLKSEWGVAISDDELIEYQQVGAVVAAVESRTARL